MKDDYYLMEPPPVEAVEACPCCGSSARVWVYSEDPTMPVTRVVMCDHSDSIGPRDSLVYEGCLLQMPPDDFYRETGRDAVRYWNEYAKALTAAQRANRWNTSQVLRGPQSDIAAAAHAQGLREREQQTKAYATTLAVSLHAQHFSEAAQWEPLPDTLGLLTQIDNMVVGLRERIAELENEAREQALQALASEGQWIEQTGAQQKRIAELEAQRVPLTKAEITACCNESDTYKTGVWMRVHETTLERLVRAIERAHGIEEVKR